METTQAALAAKPENESSPVPLGAQSTVIAASELHKHFGAVRAVDGVSLQIYPGQIVALLGPNGAGKTTLIDVLLGLTRADSGHSELFDMPPRAAIARSLVGVTMQSGGLPLLGSVRQILSMLAATYPDPLPVEQALAQAGIAHLAKRAVSKLSGGQTQALRLAIALLPRPQLLVLDEPTNGMDVAARNAFWERIKQQTAAGVTVVFATHYLAEAQEVAERVVMMRAGQVVADSTLAELLAVNQQSHVQACVADLSPGEREALMAALPAGDWRGGYSGDLIKLTGTHLEGAARLLLDTQGVTNFEMRRSTLEDVYRSLVQENPDEPAAQEAKLK